MPENPGPYAVRRPLLLGANPFATLYSGDEPSAYASVWRVDWSIWGSGNVLILWYDGRLHVVGDDGRLAGRIEEYFVRNFDEATALPGWPAATVTVAETAVNIDPTSGTTAHGGDITVRLSGILDARPFAAPEFPLHGRGHGLSMQVLPCAEATVTLAGRCLPGAPRVTRDDRGRPLSSAVCTLHEAWSG